MKNISIGDNDLHIKYNTSKINEGYTFDDLHDTYELFYCIKSDMEIFIGDSKYEIKNGDMFFINPNVIHHIFYNEINHYERYVIHFKKSFISDTLKVLDLESLFAEIENTTCKKVSLSLKDSSRFDALFKALTHDTALNTQRHKLGLILILLEYYEELKKNQPEKDTTRKALQAMHIVKYLDANFCNDITLDSLEREFFLNKFYICHVFKETTGFSVFQYIQYRRVIEAQKLLKHTDKDINEICFDCGFNNLQSFYKVFKKVLGITPGKCKK